MVLRQREDKMSSEQPVKKKPKREINHSTDETDFIHTLSSNSVQSNLQALHLSMAPNVNEDDINSVNLELSSKSFLASDSELEKSTASESDLNSSERALPSASVLSETPSVESPSVHSIIFQSIVQYPIDDDPVPQEESASSQDSSLNDFQQNLIKQCLCGVPETILEIPAGNNGQQDSVLMISLEDQSSGDVLQFLSNLQLLFDVYLKQNDKGFICSKIVSNCQLMIQNPDNIIEQIIALCKTKNRYVSYLAARVFSSFLIIAKSEVNSIWLEIILEYLNSPSFCRVNWALDVIKQVVEWKDVEIHVLEDKNHQVSSNACNLNSQCVTVSFKDAESFDTSGIKGMIIKSLESKWSNLISRIQHIILDSSSIDVQTCVLTFLTLWERIISVKANLSVIDIKPFYAHLETFVGLLSSSLPTIIWEQLLSLFNEVLCYGSTLALQDMVPDDTCQLAHLIVRYVKDYRLLDNLPFRRDPGFTVNSFVGTIPSNEPSQSNVDRTLIQKMILLVLKSVAVTIKETRSDSSDSSVGSDDSDFYQDMQLIERSIRDVLRKVDAFVKNALDFHPETPFCKILVHLFNDQDNYLIESLVCTLDISIGVSYRNAVFSDLGVMLNPVHSFMELLKIVSHDADVLLDYLVGSETCFLLYLLRFLKYSRRNWARFVSSCNRSGRFNELELTMTVLIRLKIKINRLVSRNLFPYNINPILKLLTTCENLYEGNEFS